MPQLTTKYGEYINAADTATEIVRIRQCEKEKLFKLVNKVLNLTKIVFKYVVQRDGEAVQAQ